MTHTHPVMKAGSLMAKIFRRFACLIAAAGAGCGDASDNGTPTGPGTLTRLSISRPLTLTTPGQTVQLTATAQFGTTVKTVTSETQWTSLDPTIATVSPGGLITAAGLGQTTISGTYESLTETTPVAVLFAARRLQVTGNVALGAVG